MKLPILPLLALIAALSVGLFAGLFAVPLAAQDAAPPAAENGDTIIVTGQGERVTVAQTQRQARDIAVRQGNVFEVPLARFEDRLCPGVIGLTAEMAAMMIDRVRANARMLDVRVQDDGCQANFILVFTEDGGTMLRQLMDNNPSYFQYLSQGQKNDILEPGPVHVWTSVEPRTLTGMPIQQVRDMTRPPVVNMVGVNSLIATSTRRDITAVMVTFDTAAVRDLSVGQLADYATMRGLAQTRPAGGLAIDSILSLFEATDTPPNRLTDFDVAYLRALYAGNANLPAAMKLSSVGSTLRGMTQVGSETGE